MEKLAKLARTYDYLVPWILLALAAGATFAILQVLVAKLIR